MSDNIRIPASVLARAVPGVRQIGIGVAPGAGSETTPVLVHEPGGDLLKDLKHPSFGSIERFYRVLPEEGWFSPGVNSRNPIQLSLGTFDVPNDQVFWIYDYEFWVDRFSGVDAGDFLRAEESRYSGAIGFDINVSSRRQANLSFELDPVPSQVSRPQFEPRIGQGASTAQFNRAAARSFSASTNIGNSLLPSRSNKYGARSCPFTIIAQATETVNLNAVIWNPIQTPIAAIGGRVAGYLISEQLNSALINKVAPR